MLLMNKPLFKYFAWIAIVGIINCVVVEPAIAELHAHQENESHQSEDGHCDVICHTCHHLWNHEMKVSLTDQPLILSRNIFRALEKLSNPPTQGIFHPPAII